MNDLIRRKEAVDLLREKANGYVVSMFATSSDCNIARLVATECASEVSDMQSFDLVHCSECDHSRPSPYGHPWLIWCQILGKHRRPDWFCGDGDRRKEG